MVAVKTGRSSLQLGGTTFSQSMKSPSSDYIPNSWFLIQVLINLNSTHIESIKNNYDVDFNPTNMISPGWFKAFLDEKSLQFFFQNQNFNIYQLHAISDESINNTNGKLLVQATESWNPIYPINYQRLGQDYYSVSYVQDISDLQNDKSVFSIKKYPNRVLLNRYTGNFLETGTKYEKYSWNYRKYAEINITGKNQIINIVDSGVDATHCAFYDPDHEVPINKTDKSHRKIVRIDPWVDALDHARGHGTHVCGIALGKAYKENSGMSLYNGVAQDAKLYMTDLGVYTYHNDVSGDYDLTLTSQIMVEMNSTISSNSWGFLPDPAGVRLMHDTEAWNFPNITWVFAAGNKGRYNTINTAGDSKNVITVGSAVSPSMAQIESYRNAALLTSEGSFVLYEDWASSYWDTTREENSNYIINREIKAYKENQNYDQNIVIVRTNNENEICNLINQLEGRGIAAVIAPNYCKTAKSKIPFFVHVEINKIKENILGTITFQNLNNRQMVTTGSSSKGPTKENILKPEVVAPGQMILSASAGNPERKTPGDCSAKELFKNSGTSMATPSISGLAALVHQYMVDKHKTYPSSALTRAIIINSCDPLDKQSKEPNHDSGFGMPHLSNTLPIDSSTNILFKDYLQINESQQYKFKFTVKKSCRLCVTMSYLDPPVFPKDQGESAYIPLFADLDLIVITPNSKLILGNQLSSQKPEKFSTNERVLIDDASPGEYTAYVKSNEFPISQSIIFAFVVSGVLGNNLDVSLTNECIGHRCKCNTLQFGYDCSEDIIEITDGNDKYVDLKARDYQYYKITVTNVSEQHPFKLNIISNSISASLVACFSFDKFQNFNQNLICFRQDGAGSIALNGEDYPEISNDTDVYMLMYTMGVKDAQIWFNVDPLQTVWWTTFTFRLIVGVTVGVGVLALIIFFIVKYINYLSNNDSDNTPMIDDQEVEV